MQQSTHIVPQKAAADTGQTGIREWRPYNAPALQRLGQVGADTGLGALPGPEIIVLLS
ncbi:MAG: hypothetical protein JNJ60_21810 [Rhodocyclaceae bacterium]|nr:hypothetical protein [Rhodocyclaceae bacterium]